MNTPPDLILVNGTVITVDARDRIAEAVAIRGDRIIAVGDTAFIESLARANTRRIDLAGHTVAPDHPIWLSHTTAITGSLRGKQKQNRLMKRACFVKRMKPELAG